MISTNNLRIGDYVIAEYEGKLSEGEVTNVDTEEKKACVATDVQEFWYGEAQLHPIPLNDEQLLKLNFEKETLENGAIKYKKGAFRLMTKIPKDFTSIEMWYREDRRQHPDVHFIHQLQNQYLDMTKVHLTKEMV